MKHKRMIVLFDANPMAIGGKSGVGHYSYFLIQSLADAYPDDLELVGHYYNFLGRKNITGLPSASNISYRPTVLFPGKITNLLRRLGLAIPFELLIKKRGDVLLFPNFLALPSLFRRPVIVTVHDLCYLDHPDYVSERNLHDLLKYVPQSVSAAKLVLAVSAFTKSSLQEAYAIPAERMLITPVPPLTKHEVSNQEAEELVHGLGVKHGYILFVGNLEPRKNLSALVSAYTRLPEDIRRQYGLVLAGGKGWKNEDLLTQITKAQTDGFNIILPGYIDDYLKAALYQRSSLVVLPSHYEGFGMPVLEAFQYGIPVAVSDIPVLREVAEEAAFYFNKDDPEDIAKILIEALVNNKAREEMISKQSSILAKYSWDDTAHTLFSKIQGLVNENCD